jgi:predicted transcriptional regulator/DNA-binding XRE family transcriptional regulator
MSQQDFTLGAKVRALRRKQRMSQTELARRLGISSSYLNLIEHNHRSVSADLLVRLAAVLSVDYRELSPDRASRSLTELLEVFSDPLFETTEVVAPDLRDFVSSCPSVASVLIRLYEGYRATLESAQHLAVQVSDGEPGSEIHSRFPIEEVAELIQRHMNYFAELEDGAVALAGAISLNDENMFTGLAAYLQRTKGVTVRIAHDREMAGAFRRFDPAKKLLLLSEVLPRGSRNFQLAHQVGLLTQDQVIDRIAADPSLSSDESRALARVALANYFAGAVLMPYDAFLKAAREERYDIELLSHRFRTSFEQTCHRLTTLRRKGSEGIPFHMMRIDIAGNISKRFSASKFQFPRFSGACPRWNVFGALLTPGLIRTQLSQMPGGQVFFDVARTVSRPGGGFRMPRIHYAIALGCDVSFAAEMVYADGLDLASLDAVVPIGSTCRLCERLDCEQRAHPPLQQPLTVHENTRGVAFYAPLKH